MKRGSLISESTELVFLENTVSAVSDSLPVLFPSTRGLNWLDAPDIGVSEEDIDCLLFRSRLPVELLDPELDAFRMGEECAKVQESRRWKMERCTQLYE